MEIQPASKSKITTDTILLLVILIVAATLRFWNFQEIPFMHDELSAMERTRYTNLQDEIDYGVTIYDTHPAGVQLFIYYWIKVFGTSEMAVKFPFILFGLLSIIIAYKISRKWFNSSVGLIVAAFMATLQYMVMYSQIARPYISGLFFCLLMVWCWSNYLFDQNHSSKKKWLIGYVVSSALCAYDHHFALLFAAIVGLTGLFFITKNTWKGYLLAGVLIFVLYIPHLNIFFFQFNKGGLGGPDGWLDKPDSNWFSTYLKYTFHFSNWMYALVFILLCLSFFFFSDEIKTKQKFRIIAFVWFLLMFFIEYYYSLIVNPIIQYSTLIFVFPFLLIFLFSLCAELSNKIKYVVVAAILITGTSTLIFTRQHFSVFYKQPYEEQVLNTYKSLDLIKDEKNATIELMLPPYYKEYYFKKYNRRFESSFYNPFTAKIDTKAFRTHVRNQQTNYFIAGNLPLEYIQIIKEKYPYIISKDEGFNYSIYCFTNEPTPSPYIEPLVYQQNFDLNKMDSTVEYGQVYSLTLKKTVPDRHAIMNVSAQLFSLDSTANPVLVMNIQENDQSINWRGAEYFNYSNDRKEFNNVYLCGNLSDFNFKKHPNAKVNIYIWNPNKKDILIKDFKINIHEGNHLIYALYEPIN